MTRPITIFSLAVLLPAAVAPALAPADALAQAQTGTGGGATSTVTAPHTSTVGRTKPPGAAAGTEPADRRDRTPQEAQDDKISRGICIGCGAK